MEKACEGKIKHDWLGSDNCQLSNVYMVGYNTILSTYVQLEISK